MDFLVEWLVQILVQIVVELVGQLALEAAFRGVARALTSRIGRGIIGSVIALSFGVFWGSHLTGRAHWPKLLWVSIALGVLSVAFAARAATDRRVGYLQHAADRTTWRSVIAPPWRWSVDRWIGFAIINFSLTIGIAVSFQPG